MTKPHETELELKFNGGNPVLNADGVGIVAYVRRDEWQRFFLAAPAMARALLDLHAAMGAGVLDVENAPAFIERVLREAGVLP